jgi:Predicted peptidase
MAMMERPLVRETAGGRCWEHEFEQFFLKVFVPDNDIDGQVNNYGFRAPCLLVFEEEKQGMDQAVSFAKESGLVKIAADVDSSVLFVYPKAEGGWEGADESLYAAVIAEIKMIQVYKDGIVENYDFFARAFKGYFVRGAIFRADIYSFGKSADYAAKHLLKTLQGEYLWGPGEITPAMVSMQGLSVIPDVQRKDIAVLSVGNSAEINRAFDGCENLLVKEKADYIADFKGFVKKFKMWCGKIELEPDFKELGMTEDAGCVEVKTSPDNWQIKDQATHKVGYFAYYNNGLFDNGPVPLVLGFHGGGDSSMYLTFVAGWWEIAHKYGFLFVSVENHLEVPAAEAVQLLEEIKKRYPVDEKRIYATGFSMGSGKSWDLFQEYPRVFAGIMPASALFPVYTTFYGEPAKESINRDIPMPVFYSGGEESPLPELPFQKDSCLERVQYVDMVNRLGGRFENLRFEDRENWEDPIWGPKADRTEKIYDPSRQSTLTVNYYASDDGVCRTAFASVSGQMHECRHHTCENAWKFISRFRLGEKNPVEADGAH